MKKSILILLVLILASFTLIAAEANSDKTIIIKAPVAPFTIFAVTTDIIAEDNYKSQEAFEKVIKNSIEKEITITDLANPVDVGYLAGINNTANDVGVSIKTTPLVSKTNKNNKVNILMGDGHVFIPGVENSKYGVLKSTVIQIREATKGAAALAPAGEYQATITVSFTNK